MKTTKTTIKLGKWAPDLQDLVTDEPFLRDARNVVPTPSGYEPWFSGASYITRSDHAFTTPICGAFHLGADIVLADKNKIKRVTNTGNTNITRSSADYHCPAHEPWRFVKFGDTLIACNGSDFPQKYDVVTDTLCTDLATDFVPAEVAVVRDFVVFGYIEAGASAKVQGNLLKWSAINNPLDYTPSVTTQSDEQLLPGENQEILKIIGGEVGYIITRSSVWRMTYVGSPNIFQFDEIQTKLPYLFRHSIVDTRDGIFMLGAGGIYRFDKKEERLHPINKGLVDQYIKTKTLDDIGTGLGGQRAQGLIRGLYYPDKELIIWAISPALQTGFWPNNSDVTTLNDKAYGMTLNLVYSLDTDSCSEIYQNTGFLWFTGYDSLSIESITAGADTFDDIGDAEILDSGNGTYRNKIFFVDKNNEIFEFDNNLTVDTTIYLRTTNQRLAPTFSIVRSALVKNAAHYTVNLAGTDYTMPVVLVNPTTSGTLGPANSILPTLNSSSYAEYLRAVKADNTLVYGEYFNFEIYVNGDRNDYSLTYKFSDIEVEHSPKNRRALEASY